MKPGGGLKDPPNTSLVSDPGGKYSVFHHLIWCRWAVWVLTLLVWVVRVSTGPQTYDIILAHMCRVPYSDRSESLWGELCWLPSQPSSLFLDGVESQSCPDDTTPVQSHKLHPPLAPEVQLRCHGKWFHWHWSVPPLTCDLTFAKKKEVLLGSPWWRKNALIP